MAMFCAWAATRMALLFAAVHAVPHTRRDRRLEHIETELQRVEALVTENASVALERRMHLETAKVLGDRLYLHGCRKVSRYCEAWTEFKIKWDVGKPEWVPLEHVLDMPDVYKALTACTPSMTCPKRHAFTVRHASASP